MFDWVVDTPVKYAFDITLLAARELLLTQIF